MICIDLQNTTVHTKIISGIKKYDCQSSRRVANTKNYLHTILCSLICLIFTGTTIASVSETHIAEQRYCIDTSHKSQQSWHSGPGRRSRLHALHSGLSQCCRSHASVFSLWCVARSCQLTLWCAACFCGKAGLFNICHLGVLGIGFFFLISLGKNYSWFPQRMSAEREESWPSSEGTWASLLPSRCRKVSLCMGSKTMHQW